VHNLKLERHRMSWRTDAPGAAHLVRMTWHPRWKLATKGQIYLAGPGFMLVVPEEADVRLEYGHSTLGVAGMVASGLALLVLLALIWGDGFGRVGRSRVLATADSNARQTFAAWAPLLQDKSASDPWPRDCLAGLWPLLLVCAGLWLHLHNPERLYTEAWKMSRANQTLAAAAEFDRAYAARKSDAKKEEALFWAAKAYEQAGQTDTAIARYRELNSRFHGYWLPESLYTQAQLEQAAGATAQAKIARERLLQEFPNDRWTARMQNTPSK